MSQQAEVKAFERIFPGWDGGRIKGLLAQAAGVDLQSLLIGIFRARAAKLKPSEVLASWEANRFTGMSKVCLRKLMAFDMLALDAASAFEAVDLSPVCPLGTCTTVAPLSQDKIIPTIRNVELVADCTNVMALECACRRRDLLRQNPKDNTLVRLCTSQRLVRAQKFANPKLSAHFRVFALCTAGRDSGHYGFEIEAVSEQVMVYLRLFDLLNDQGFFIREPQIHLYGKERKLCEAIADAIRQSFSDVSILHKGERPTSYYPTASFTITARNRNAETLELVDGGITTWGASLVQSKKERMAISGIGSERVLNCCL